MNARFKSIGMIAILTLLTNAMGFIKEIFFARNFGASFEADAYITAFTIVSTGFLVFTAGILQAAFMPRYQSLLIRNNQELAAALSKRTIMQLSVLLMIITFVMTLFSDTIVALSVPGFSIEKQILTSKLIKMMAPAIVLIGSANILQCILHAHQRFFMPALVPFLNNIFLIIILIAVVPKYGIAGFAIAVFLGASLWWFCLFPLSVRYLSGSSQATNEKNELRMVIYNLIPLVILIASDQLCAIVQKGLVSDLGSGFIAALNYSAKISGLPIGILSMAIATVFFPILVEAIAKENKAIAKKQFLTGIAYILILTIPAAFYLILNAKSLITLMFGHGKFDARAIELTSYATVWYAVGIIPQSLLVFLNKTYFAAEKMKSTMVIGIISVVLHLFLCIFLVKYYGYAGIAIATTAYAIIYCGLLLMFIKSIIPVNLYEITQLGWRPLVASSPFIYLTHVLYKQFPYGDTSKIGISFITCFVGYFIMLTLLKEPLLISWNYSRFKNRFRNA